MKSHIETIAEKGVRLDGRKFDEIRKPVSIELGVSKKAEGSAMVTIGDTKVAVGVKLAVGEPYADSSDQGVLITTAELLPLSSPKFLSGPPGQEAIELARIVDRGIRESKMIDMKKLCIRKNELVWLVFLDIYPINDAGNLIDASMLGAVAALNSAVFPKLDGDQIVYGEFTKKKIPIVKMPITITTRKIGEHLLIDTTTEEEEEVSCRLSISVGEDDNIHAMQKSGVGKLTLEEVDKIMDLATKKSKELRKVIK